MKVKKSIMALFVGCLLVLLLPVITCADVEWENVIWSEADEVRNGIYNCNLHYEIGRDAYGYTYMTVSGTGEMANYADPGYYCEADKHPGYWAAVTEDGYSIRQIARLELKPGITRIGNAAFAGHSGGFVNSNATCTTVFLVFPVTIPDTVVWIGDYAFAFNNYMGDVYIPDSVTHIGQNAFFYNVNIHCSYGSYAYDYAKANNYKIVLTGPDKLEAPKLTSSNVTSTGKIKLTWNNQSGADAYKVYRATSKNGKYKLLTTTTKTTYTDSSAIAGTLYYYKVQAVSNVNEKVNSEYSKIISRRTDLPQVTGLKLTNLSESGKVKLSWNKVDKATGYRIYRATSSSGTYYLQKTIKSVNSLSYIDSTGTPGKTYYYKVRAYHSNSAADGAKSVSVKGSRKRK